ncbi:cytochrome P450 [Jidongwangia harbinensis]|uniref:cytochrome P450 n=1 Tax=Jidongwangia harbinensis TaxID=2878561 RepID=UPI001CD9BE93|nr:cytochrome P450 [Jidongwangia harbinensis]MCA2219348.1 cytochrome P450 [Jidongwangia harbinensis]
MRLSPPTGRERVDLDEVDLIDPRLYGEGDAHPVWRVMRERAPVRWQDAGPGLGFWSVTSWADVSRVLRDHTAFTSEHGTLLNLLGKGDPAGGRQIAATDPPRHAAMRAPVQRALSVRSMDRQRDLIRVEVRRLLATVPDGEPFDLAEVTGALPMAVTGTLMGLDRSDWGPLTLLTNRSVAPDDPDYTLPEGGAATLRRAHRELFAYFQNVVDGHRDDEGEDLISTLRGMVLDDGRRLSTGEIVANCYSLLLGANVTTPHVPNAALIELMGTGGYAEWAEGGPGVLATGLEEALRWSSPANHFMRHATADLDLGGRRIRRGEAVVAWLGSANRDEAVFADPFRFDVHRRPNRHIAFGVGPHYCLGHSVARVSLEVFLTELFAEFEDIEPAGTPEHLWSNFVVGVKRLPVVARRRAPGGR